MYNDLNNLLTKLNTIKQIMINMDPSISALYDELDGNDNYINYEDIEKNEIFIDLLKGNNHDTGANVVVNGESIFKELNNPNKVNELLDNLKGNNNDTGSIKSLDAVSIMSGEM